MVFEKKKGFGKYVSDGLEAVSEGVGKFAGDKINRMADNAELRFMAFHDRLIKKITSLLFFGMATVFFSLGAFYLLKELFGFSDSISFFIIGIILLLIGIFVKSMNGKALVSN